MLICECLSEVCALRWEDVVFGEKSTAVLAVQDSKGARGDTQNAVLNGAKVVRLLKRWKRFQPRSRPRDSVFRLSSVQLNAFISVCVAKYGLKGCGFVFHSVRHGRASFDLGRKVSVETIVVRGRWGSLGQVGSAVLPGGSGYLDCERPALPRRHGARPSAPSGRLRPAICVGLKPAQSTSWKWVWARRSLLANICGDFGPLDPIFNKHWTADFYGWVS